MHYGHQFTGALVRGAGYSAGHALFHAAPVLVVFLIVAVVVLLADRR